MSRDIPITLIDRDEAQPRQHFDATALAELAQSIAANGLAVPILLRSQGERYIIVHGERRYRAVCSLGWQTIPADVRDMSEDEAQWLALVENIQRDDLSPIEEARAYRARLDAGMTQEALGQRIGKTQSYIATKLRFLKLPRFSRWALEIGDITEGHAKQLLRIRPDNARDILTTIIRACRLSVHATAVIIDRVSTEIPGDDQHLAGYIYHHVLTDAQRNGVTDYLHQCEVTGCNIIMAHGLMLQLVLKENATDFDQWIARVYQMDRATADAYVQFASTSKDDIPPLIWQHLERVHGSR